MSPFPALAELQALLNALCEGSSTPEQVQRLEELILSSPEAEAYYIQYMSLYADLIGHFTVLPTSTEHSLRERARAGRREGERGNAMHAQARGRRRSRSRRRLSGILMGLAGLAAGLVLALVLSRREPAGSTPSPAGGAEALDNSVAVLLQAPGAVWEETGQPLRAGAPLAPGRLRLKSGFAHFEFYSGATVILQGPADFRLISSQEAYCARGKLRATVPPQAQGFTIGSPRVDLVDRGTEFGLQVHEGGKTEVHVFQGKVDLYAAGSNRAAAPRRALTTGRGLRLEGPGHVRPIRSDPAAFLTPQQLAARWEDAMRQRQQQWLTASAALRRDPSLVVYYSFQAEDPWSRTLRDRAGGRRPHDGAIVGCAWVAGRWAGKQGLEFKRVSDRVRFHLPGEFDALTLAAWVRVDALPNRFNSLMMTDGWEEAAPHWHLGSTGKVELGVQGRKGQKGVHYLTPVVFTPERLGQWCHLAVVHDRGAGLVTHYVDGQPIRQEALKLDVALRLGDAEIGNWNVGVRRHNHPIRYFSGCMDEFMLFGRALSAREIEWLCTQGRPPS
jgi:hypothetical protein